MLKIWPDTVKDPDFKREVLKSGIVAIVVDMQEVYVNGRTELNGFADVNGCSVSKGIREGAKEEIVPRQQAILRQCADYNIPVINIEYKPSRHGDTIPEIQEYLDALPTYYTMIKFHDNAFEDSPLDELLTLMGAHTLVLMGVNAEACVKETTMGAMRHKYQVMTSGEVLAGKESHSRDNGAKWYRPRVLWAESTTQILSFLAEHERGA